ncbi:MAG: phosphoglycerate dehydrogenase [Deltaproteobacteria bacterium]|nr:phosphoglycerate dehydrogenase [Deltaproteobacteria bacterium]
MKILISDNLAAEGMKIFEEAGFEVDARTSTPADEILKIIGEYDGLVIRSATKITPELLEKATRLKVIGRAGAGLDNVDIPAASQKGVVVMNTPGGNTVTTAEHTVAMIMSLCRNIPQATASLKANKWEKKKFTGTELMGKTLGIIGLGNIGKNVAKRARGLEMKVVGYDPYMTEEMARSLGVRLVSLDEIYAESDIITVHTPMTPETKHLINRDTIAKMKDGVRLVNCARGGIIKETDLLEALQSGKVTAAALDVFETEPPVDNPLLALDNVIATPHLGASTSEAQVNVAVMVASQMVEYLTTGVAKNARNMAAVSPEEMEKIQPYISLGEKLGSFLGQVADGRADRVTMEYFGDAADLNSEPVTTAILKGFLSNFADVNYVSAPYLAKERGIKTSEVKSNESPNFKNKITISVEGKYGKNSISGTLFNNRDPRIVMVDGMTLEAVPEGEMLIFRNHDKPGVIGSVGRALADAKINIARMQFGREEPGGKAISIVNVDSPVDAELLDKLAVLPNVVDVRVARL